MKNEKSWTNVFNRHYATYFHGMIKFVAFEILHEGLGGFIVIRKSIHENKT
jgi:hypothetical protein